jgi:hypothetical protein
MIKTETLTIGGKQFIRTYSDNGMMIHGGSPEADYSEALDPAELGRTYTETDIPVEGDEATAEEIVEILTGETA